MNVYCHKHHLTMNNVVYIEKNLNHFYEVKKNYFSKFQENTLAILL